MSHPNLVESGPGSSTNEVDAFVHSTVHLRRVSAMSFPNSWRISARGPCELAGAGWRELLGPTAHRPLCSSQLQHSSTPAAQQGSLLQRSNCVSCTLWSKSDHFSSSFWVEEIMEALAEHYSQSGRVVEFPPLKRMIGHFFTAIKIVELAHL